MTEKINQRRTATESGITNMSDFSKKSNSRNTTAIAKYTIFNHCYAFGYNHFTNQIFATVKCRTAYARNGFGNSQIARKVQTTRKGMFTNCFQRSSQIKCSCKAHTTSKGIIANRFHRVRNQQVSFQFLTTRESTFTNRLQAIREHQFAVKPRTRCKCMVANRDDRRTHYKCGQIITSIKSLIANTCHTHRQRKMVKTIKTPESPITDMCNSMLNNYRLEKTGTGTMPRPFIDRIVIIHRSMTTNNKFTSLGMPLINYSITTLPLNHISINLPHQTKKSAQKK